MISTTYSDIAISYNEDRDMWEFTLNGKDRSAKSLANAKAAIDKPEPKEKKFEPIPAFKLDRWGSNKPVHGSITSVCENNGYSSSVYVWFVAGKQRSKEDTRSLFTPSESNLALVKEIYALRKEEETLSKKRQHKTEQLVCVEIAR